MAKEASLGIFGLCLIISRDKSLIDSMAAANSPSSFEGTTSSTFLIFAVKYGSSDTSSVISKRFFP